MNQGLYEVRGILIDPQDPNRMYVYGDGGFWKTEDGGENWKSMELPETLPPEFLAGQLVTAPSNNMVLYLATVQGIFKTTDGGESWTNITDGIDDANIFSIGVVDSDKIYVGTAESSKDQNRLYYTTDGGENWSPMNDGLTDYETGTYPPPNVATPLRIDRKGAVLYLGTRGAGVFKRFIKPLLIAEAGPDQTVDEDTVVTLDGSSSISHVNIVSYVWAFTDVSPKSLSGETVIYNFTNPGVYLITLNVTDALGNSDTDTVVITVNDKTPPVANAGTGQTVKVKTQVSFNAAGSSDNVGIVSYEWDFGDGAIGTGEKATHTYAKAGTYIVVLTVTDAAGHRDTDTLTVTVMEEERFPAWMSAAVIAAVVAVAITVYFILIRKKS